VRERERLEALEREILRLEEELKRLVPGLRLKHVYCGKEGCWCARARKAGLKGHGPYYYRYVWDGQKERVGRDGEVKKGKQTEKYVGKSVEAWPSTWRAFRALGKRLAKLTEEKERLLTQEVGSD